MSYQIFINNKNNAKVDIHLDNKTLPVYPNNQVFFGTGKVADKYSKYIKDCFSKDQKMMRCLAFFHRQGKEKGNLNLICNKPKLRPFYPQAVKAFLEENKETLDMMLPYLFTDYAAPQSDTAPVPKMSKATLPAEDMAQIQELIRQDQEREAQLKAQEQSQEQP